MHIVLVDGSRTGLAIIYRMLEPRGDTVAMFTDGREALDYIRDTPEADMLITSIEIATLPGTELCWQARVLADAGRPLYVVAMSSTESVEQEIEILDAGADDFMTKPPRAGELAARLRVAERTLQLQRRLIEHATTDSLTGLLNHRAYRAFAEEHVAAVTPESPLSLVLFDIDFFKRVNDTYGHDAGDRVLQAIGSLRVPPDAAFARVGGEEFAIVLPGIPQDGAISVAEYIRSQIEALEISYGRETLKVTASIGVAECPLGANVSELHKLADTAQHLAKSNGRNRVVTVTTSLSNA